MKHFKRMIPLLLAFMLAVSMILPVFAAETGSISASAAAVKDDSVSVTLSVTNNPGFAALKLELSYDTDKLTFSGAEKGSFDMQFNSYRLPDGKVNLLWDKNSGNAAGNGTLAVLSFRVNGGAEGSAEISLRFVEANDWDLNSLRFDAAGCTVKIGGAAEDVPGDVPGDTPGTPGTPGDAPGGTTGGVPAKEEPEKVRIIVDGREYDIGTGHEDKLSRTVQVDAVKLAERLKGASAGSRIVVPLTGEKSVNTAVMTVGNIMDAAKKQMELQIICGGTQIIIPADSVDTAAILKELAGQNAYDIPFAVTVTVLSAAEREALGRQIGYELVGDAVSFRITAGSGNAVCTVKRFSGWTERILPAAEAADITTGVEIVDGRAIHKPTNGRTIYSLTDSLYAYIHNELSFADAEDMWFQDTVNEMASRLIVNGRGEDCFDGQGTITRAEFVTILIRGLGLHEDGDGSVFSDVSAEDWYCGAVGRACEDGLVMGRDDGRFAPNDRITRQEAMILMERAAKLLGMKGSYGTLEQFTDADQVDDWALSAVRFNVGSGLIQGFENRIYPRDSMTRAESATVILRLLRTAGWIGTR